MSVYWGMCQDFDHVSYFSQTFHKEFKETTHKIHFQVNPKIVIPVWIFLYQCSGALQVPPRPNIRVKWPISQSYSMSPATHKLYWLFHHVTQCTQRLSPIAWLGLDLLVSENWTPGHSCWRHGEGNWQSLGALKYYLNLCFEPIFLYIVLSFCHFL